MDYAPIGYTCPTIDGIISKLDEIENNAKWISENKEEDFGYEISSIIDLAVDSKLEIEDLRTDNDVLRGWGNELYGEKESLESEISDLETELDELKSEIDELKSRLNDCDN